MYETIPVRYLVQCQVQMSASQRQPNSEGFKKVTFAAWKQDAEYGVEEIKVWQILHSPTLESLILEHIKVFTDFVRSRTKPPRFSKNNPKMEIPTSQIISAQVYPEFRLGA